MKMEIAPQLNIIGESVWGFYSLGVITESQKYFNYFFLLLVLFEYSLGIIVLLLYCQNIFISK